MTTVAPAVVRVSGLTNAAALCVTSGASVEFVAPSAPSAAVTVDGAAVLPVGADCDL
jgi:hypothetical protein